MPCHSDRAGPHWRIRFPVQGSSHSTMLLPRKAFRKITGRFFLTWGLTLIVALISATVSSSVGNWYIWTPLLTSSLMILLLNLCSSFLAMVSAFAIIGMMFTYKTNTSIFTQFQCKKNKTNEWNIINNKNCKASLKKQRWYWKSDFLPRCKIKKIWDNLLAPSVNTFTSSHPALRAYL